MGPDDKILAHPLKSTTNHLDSPPDHKPSSSIHPSSSFLYPQPTHLIPRPSSTPNPMSSISTHFAHPLSDRPASPASGLDRERERSDLPPPSSLGKRSRSPASHPPYTSSRPPSRSRIDEEIDELAPAYDSKPPSSAGTGVGGEYARQRLPPMLRRSVSPGGGREEVQVANYTLPPTINRLPQITPPTNPSYHPFPSSSHPSTLPPSNRPMSPEYPPAGRRYSAPQQQQQEYHSQSQSQSPGSGGYEYRDDEPGTAGAGGGAGGGGGGGKGDLPARRQNVACDGCRGRKVKCNRAPGAEKCEHCKQKNLACTSFYVTQVSSARKLKQAARDPTLQPLRVQDLEPASARGMEMGSAGGYVKEGGVGNGDGRMMKRVKTDSGLGVSYKHEFNSFLDPQTQLSHLLAYLLSPTLVNTSPLGYRDWAGRQGEMGWPLAPTFDGQPSAAHRKLLSEEDRKEFADDLMETYYSIVHIRLPILDTNSFKRRFRHPNVDPEGLPSLPLVACVLAWGAKFSEHPLIMQDREECSLGLQDGRKRSRLVQMMTCRAQEVMETHKVFRVASLDNIHAAMMASMMNGEDIASPLRHKPYWPSVAVSHIVRLGYNKRSSVLNLRSHKERMRAELAFWLSTWMDAITGCYYRAQPFMHDDDVDLDPLHSFDGEGMSDNSAALTAYMAWHTALGALSKICRQVAVQLHVPKVEKYGIPLAALRNFTAMLSTWRDSHLTVVGVPTVWPPNWDFVAAVTACASDSNYHVLWVILSKSITDYGIAELKTIERGDFKGSLEESDSLRLEAERTRDRIAEEALHGALRISALAAVLAANSYLRLDPNVLFYAIYNAGILLANLGRREVSSCIAGMRQYGLAYEEAFDRVDEVERIVASRTNSLQAPPSMFGAQQQMNSHSGGAPLMYGHGHSTQQQQLPGRGFPQMPMQQNNYSWAQSQIGNDPSRNNGMSGGGHYYGDR